MHLRIRVAFVRDAFANRSDLCLMREFLVTPARVLYAVLLASAVRGTRKVCV